MENILKRINKIADKEGISITMLESRIGASKGVLSRALAKNTDIQTKWVIKIVENYPLYDVRWLLTGKGDMLSKEFEDIKAHRQMAQKRLETLRKGPDAEKAIEISYLKEMLESKEKLIVSLEKQIKLLEDKQPKMPRQYKASSH